MRRLLALCALVLVLVPAFAAAVSVGHRHAHAKARAARGQVLSAAQSVSLVQLDALMSAHMGAGVGAGDEEDDNDATKDKAPVPPAIPAKIEIIKEEEKFPPNQPGAPKAPALAPGPGEKPAPALAAGRFEQTGFSSGARGDDEDDEAEGPAKTESKTVGDGEDEEGDGEDGEDADGEGKAKGKGKKKELTDEEKEKKAAAKDKLPFSGGVKAFPHDRPLPARGALKPPLSCPPRWLHTMVKIDNKLYVFGGVAAYSHKFWNDLWMYDVTDKEWRNTQASYIPPFPAANLIFQKPPENELYRPSGLPAPPPLLPSPMSGDDDDAINRPGGAQSPAGDAEPLPAEVSSPDPSAIGAPNDGAAKLPSAAELKKMQDAEAMKKKLSAQKRREKLSPAARLEAKRKRALRRKRMIALANTRAKKAEAKRLRKLEEQWKQKWYKEFEGKREKWEKEHKHNEHVTVDLTGNKPVSVSISKPEAKLTPATDEEKKKAEEADAETAKADESASGGSGGSGGSDAAEPAKDESSDGNAEDEARFRQFHSAHLVNVAADGSQRVSHQRHRRIAHTHMPEGMGDLFSQSEPVTHATSEAHAQWMGDFTALLQLDAAYGGHGTTEPVDAMDDGLDAALSAHAAMSGAGAAGPNKLVRLVLQHRKRSLMHAKQQTPRYMRPSEAQSFFQAYERIGFGGFSGFDGFSGFGTPNPPPPPAGAPGTFAEVGSFAGAAGGAGAAAAAAAGAGVGAAAGAGAVAGMYGGVGAREDDADLPKGALDPDADHAVVQDQQHPKYTTPFVGDEVWEFNIDTKQWKFIPKAIRLGNAFPQPRWLHSAVVIDGKMVIFGGVNPDSVILGDVWIFDPNSHEWMNAKIEGVPILPREGHTATAVGNSMIVIGGISYAYSPFDDVWTYLSGENKWVMNKPKGPKPPPRWMHTAVLHASKSGARSIFVFGGITHQYVPLNDLWRLNVESMTWEHPQTKGHAPFPRMLHAAVIFEDDMFVHAGGANNLLHEDLWKITLTDDAMAWEEQLPAGASPFARMGHTLTGVSPPMNPTPSRDPRPAWHPPDNSVPSPKVQKPFPIRPRKEYSTNRYFYCFGGARNNW